jgi:hypothetical protein
VTTPTLLSPLEIQRRVVQAIGKASYSWPPARLLPMLPHEGTEKLVSHRLLDEIWLIYALHRDVSLLGDL